MINPDHITPQIADDAERMVDKWGIGYDEAYRRLGLRHEEPPRTTMLRAAIGHYDRAQELRGLAARGSRDPAVKRAGGVRLCAAQAVANERSAHQAFFDIYGAQTVLPLNPGAEEVGAHDEAVRRWSAFRVGVLENPDRRRELDVDLRDLVQEDLFLDRLLEKYTGGTERDS